MKKILLIIFTVIVIAIGGFGFWIYDIVKNGVSQYTIAGETVGLAGFSSEVSAGAPNIATATFSERLMPFTVATFPFDEACSVVAPDFERTDILTLVATSDEMQIVRVYDVDDGVCTERSG